MKLSLPRFGNNETAKYALKAAALAFFAAVITLLPFVIAGGGALFLRDDFNYQQVVFSIICGNFVKDGNFAWSWYTDLGSSVIGSYSFYNLASPFALLTSFLPSSAIPYMTAPVIALKYCVAALTSFFYIKRFVKNPDTAVFGSVLYAFCGYQTMNLLFPFHDVTALFPLMLIAVEEIGQNRRGTFGLLALVSALLCATNYYLFFGQIIFLIIYYVFRFVIGSDAFGGNKSRIKDTLLLALRFAIEGLLGICIAAVIFLPSALSVLQNPRLDSAVSDVIFHWTQYLAIGQSLFLPSDVMGSQAYFIEKACTSCALCLPLTAMSFVFAYMLENRKKPLTIMTVILGIIACVPVLNSAFSMFNAHYYARWFYMAALIFALMSSIAIDKATSEADCAPTRKFLIRGTIINFIFTILLVAAEFGLIAFFKATSHPYLARINIKVTALYAIFALTCSAALIFIIKIKDNKKFLTAITACALAVSIITSGAALYRYQRGTTTESGYGQDITNTSGPLSADRNIEIFTDITAEKLSLPNEQNYRIRTAWYDRGLEYNWHSYDNLSMTIGMPSVNSFISTVSGGIFEFYQGLGIDRNVTTVANDDPALSVLLSCRYYLTSDPTAEQAAGKTPVGTYTHSDGTTIYTFEYDNYLPFGFTYDHYMTETQLAALPTEVRPYALLRAIVIPDNTSILDNPTMKPYAKTTEYADLLAGKQITAEDITAATAAHQNGASTSFTRNSTSFTATINSDGNTLAYFSVPADSGWTATVNGAPTTIITSNGMMAVPLSDGPNFIHFTYKTPALRLGACLSILGLATVAVVWGIEKRKKLL